MFMLSGRITDEYWNCDEGVLESSTQQVMVVDSRTDPEHTVTPDGRWLADELLVVTVEGQFYWVPLDAVEAKPLDFRPTAFGPAVPDLPKIQ